MERKRIKCRIAIVEDMPAEAELLKLFFEKYQKETAISFEIDSFQSGKYFLEKYQPVYDLILMDIGLPQINGMDTAVRLRKLDEAVTLVFVTNMANFAIRGYEVGAFDFILKPVSYPEFMIKMRRVLKRLQIRQDQEIVINQSKDYYRCAISQIQYIEVSAHNILYHTSSGTIPSYGSLKQVEENLNGSPFARCNSCYLVNLDYVRTIKDDYVILTNGEQLKISRMKRRPFIQALNQYLGEG